MIELSKFALKNEMSETHMTVAQLVKKSGLSRAVVDLLIDSNVVSNPTLKTVEKLATALEVHPTKLLRFQ